MSQRTQKHAIYLANEGSVIILFISDLKHVIGMNFGIEFEKKVKKTKPHKREFVQTLSAYTLS